MKYLVMECHPGYAVLLDEEGRFLKAANMHYEVGQTVEDPVLLRCAPEKRKVVPFARALTAVAACLALVFGFGFYYNYVASYSAIILSINPQVRLELNRQGQVVSLVGTNQDGVELLKDYDGRGKDKVTVADELIDRAIAMGFLSQGGQVSFNISAPDELVVESYSRELRSGVEEYFSNRITIDLNFSAQETVPSQPKELTLQDALTLALRHAGVDVSQASVTALELVRGEEISYFQVEFTAGDVHYIYHLGKEKGRLLYFRQYTQ